jgi:hypothetical protein
MLGLQSAFSELQPDGEGLFQWLQQSLTEDEILAVAACDYGDQVEEHRAAIVKILDTRGVSELFDWVPREVLALTRWTNIEPSTATVAAISAHRQRLLATAALMSQLTLDPLDEDASESSLFGFVDSAMALRQQALALGLLGSVIQGLEAQVEKEAELARQNGDDEFEPADVTGREVAFLPLAILILDRSQDRRILSSATVRKAVSLGRTLDHPYADPGLPPPSSAFFHQREPGIRDAEWRSLIRAAVEREHELRDSGQQGLDAEASAAYLGWMELALATGKG